ncbi:MAG: type II toxin-antitoxin system Phd/YefM family antitoxin [Gammaproteobacteria bacterium]|nr:type II toxin-antitoxin system Phd/YefM family antitoxin [Gammaproteobacteria bacterium]
MKKVGSYEAKTHLPRMLHEVAERGENYLITKNDRPVARLSPVENTVQRNPSDVIADIQALKTRQDCSDVTWEEVTDAIQMGRR